MTFSYIVELVLETGKKLIDVLIVWLALYYILKNLRKNVKMVLLFKGILIVLILKVISDLLDLVTIGFLLDYVIEWGPLALIVIFQPEIRSVLEQLGRSQLLGRHKVLTVDEREKMVYEITNALDYLRKQSIGALIVIERDNSLNDYIEKSICREKILNNTPILSDLADNSVKVINEFIVLKNKYNDKTISESEFNNQAIQLFLKYDVITKESLDRLVELGKIEQY